METVIVTFKSPISLEDINQKLTTRWLVESAGKDALVVQSEGGRVYIHPNGSEQSAGEWQRFLIDYSSVELLKQIITLIADSPNCVLDNDFGVVMRGDEFVARLKADPTWDWRREVGA